LKRAGPKARISVDAQENPYLSPSRAEPSAPASEIPDSIWIPRVAGGLGTIVFGMLLSLLTLVVQYSIMSQVAVPFITVRVAAYFMYLATALWCVVGLFSCRATPPRIAAVGLVHFLLIVALLSLGLHVADLIFLTGDLATIPTWLFNANLLLWVPASLAFGWYLIRMATFIDNVELTNWARFVFAANAALGAADVLYLVYKWANPLPPGSLAIGIVRLVSFVSSIAVSTIYAVLTNELRKALLARLEATEPDVNLPLVPDRIASVSHNNGPASARRATTGLAPSLFGIVLVLLATAAPAVRWIAPEFGWTRAGVLAVTEVMVMVGVTLKLIGALRCLATPEVANARLPVQIAAGSAALSLFLRTSAYFAARGVLRPLDLPVDLASLLDAVWSVSFLVYLQRLSVFVERPELTRWRKPLLVGVVVLALLNPAISWGLLLILPVGSLDFEYPIFVALKLIYFYGTFVVYLLYATVIWRIRGALRQSQ
jgi:hypothetical protein